MAPPDTPAETDPRALWAAGRAAWPDVGLPFADFEAFLAERPDRSHPADLYLACACAAGDATAHAAFAATHRDLIERATRRLVSEGAAVDDLAQHVLTVTLLGAGGPPRIGRYSGRGPLASWIAVVASREALELLRRQGRAGRRSATDLVAGAPVDDAELAYMKRVYRGALEQAIEGALGALSTRARLMLRYSAVEGLGIDAIARLQGVHRATAARWLSRARDDLVRQARARLMREADLSPSEADSVHRLVMSQVEISLARLLTSRPT